MKKATVILLLIMLFKPVLPVLEYVIMYDYIKNELCVNKDKPELNCNGKCYLKKAMAQAAANDNSKSKGYSFSVESSVIFFQKLSIISVSIPIEILNFSKKILTYQRNYHFIVVSNIFKPPVF
ncbi:hypothetical protein P3875_01625 [Myroides sp. JBRI-B21084]|uniref:hypothetical protein n=1 Tax=Myroides sp. JBRI-B21084 TaxID=3119977 RepID=UPI0026E2F616|nr:hypothetical protein [Paenimyroides cloacae]WKW46800.1 hypothetical protein P3875_01625 [Paenimyroides cloacae]